MPELELKGCRPEPLMSYLKAIGVLRIVAEQADGNARANWEYDILRLCSTLDEKALISFFVHEYKPTPIVVPWSGNDFFGVQPQADTGPFGKAPSSSTVIQAFLGSTSERLKPYRENIEIVLEIIRQQEITKSHLEAKNKPGKRAKARFISALRSNLSDEVLSWIDAATLLSQESAAFNTLLGSGGGNDANTHFSDNFMQNLWDCLPDFDHQRKKRSNPFSSENALRGALFGIGCRDLIRDRTAALFDGGAVGGPNSTQGMERQPITNPWDFILTIEGTLCLAGAVVRRHQALTAAAPAFPFTVRSTAVGYGTATSKDAGQNEIWLPLWRRPMNLAELIFLYSEGRSQLGKRRAVNGIDFARAIGSLGVDAGIVEFVRYGIVRGRVGGQNYHTALSLGRFKVTPRPNLDLLAEIDGWLEGFRRVCQAENPSAPPRFASALRRLDTAVLDYCRYGTKSRFGAILRALGRIECELALLSGKIVADTVRNPIPVLSAGWIKACDDGSPEFRIGVALASIYDGVGRTMADAAKKEKVGPFRKNLEPVERRGRNYMWAEKGTAVVWSRGTLCKNLLAVLERRLMDAYRNNLEELPLNARCSVTVDDVALFLNGLTDDHRLEEFIWGAMLVDQKFGYLRAPEGIISHVPLPRNYALLKLLFMPGPQSLKSNSDTEKVRSEPSILWHLRAGALERASEVAARRLRASGFLPMLVPVSKGRAKRIGAATWIDPLRLAAALLIPVSEPKRLREMVLRPTEEFKA